MSLLMLNESEIAHICICRACHHDLDQNSGKHGYIPRSIKLRNNKAPSISVDVQKCNVTGCSNQADIKSTASINLDDTPSGIAFDTSNLSTNLCLCTQYYYRLYKHQHQKPIQCTTCNELPKPSEQFNRHCPNPTVIEKYLRVTEGFSGSICENDIIYYKKRNELLNTLQLFNLLPVAQPNSAVSSIDSELDNIIQHVMLQLQDLEQGIEEHAVLSTILMVGTTIRKDNAILLPAAHKHFTSSLKQPPPRSRECTCRWLLKELEKVLSHHMTSTCKHKKHGTVLSRTGGDLMNALSYALSVSSKSATNSEPTSAVTDKSGCTCSIEDKICEVGEFLNHKLHNLASTLIENDKREPFNYQTLDIDKQMEMVDPALTQHILTLTKSYNEKKQLYTADEHSLSAHTKKVRRFYSLCVLLFCTNSRCCMPMHLLLTDVVKHHGGSSELIKILNRVGAVSSEDTHGRLVTFISQQREKEMETEFNPQAFKLASVDNIDVLSHYTKAYGICRKNVQYMARHIHPVCRA